MSRKLVWPIAAASLAAPASADDLREALTAGLLALMELYRDLCAHYESQPPGAPYRGKAGRADAPTGIRRDRRGRRNRRGGRAAPVATGRRCYSAPTWMRCWSRANRPAFRIGRARHAGFRSRVQRDACVRPRYARGCVDRRGAPALAAQTGPWWGTLVMIAQPGEEARRRRAQAVLDDGLFGRFPKADYALASRNAAQYLSGMIGCVSGCALANVDSVVIVCPRRGGHGALSAHHARPGRARRCDRDEAADAGQPRAGDPLGPRWLRWQLPRWDQAQRGAGWRRGCN